MRRSGALAALVLLTACSVSPNQRAATATTHASTTTSTSTTTTIPLARPCIGADLSAHVEDTGASGGTTFVRVGLTNVSTTRCSLSGYPTSITGTSTEGEPFAPYEPGSQIEPEPANLDPGAMGVVVLNVAGTACDQSPGYPPPKIYRDLEMGVPGGGTVTLREVNVERRCGFGISRLGVLPDSPE